MAKRFTDSRKWDDDWFDELDPKYKFMWVYMLDKCDHAGFFKPNLKQANYHLGVAFSKEELLEVFKTKIIECKNQWFLTSFIPFQYGELKSTNNLHISIQNKLIDSGVDQGLVRGWAGDKDKDKDKDKK